MTTKIAGRTLEQWQELARRDDCFEQMVPSDLRQLVGALQRKSLRRYPAPPIVVEPE